jgi:site-specific DNA-methyltransferase (adenine-specific)
MFSFVGDTVLDPFAGTGTTMVAALRADRNSIGLDIDADYCRMAARRLMAETATLFNNARLVFQKSVVGETDGAVTLREAQADYTTAVP